MDLKGITLDPDQAQEYHGIVTDIMSAGLDEADATEYASQVWDLYHSVSNGKYVELAEES